LKKTNLCCHNLRHLCLNLWRLIMNSIGVFVLPIGCCQVWSRPHIQGSSVQTSNPILRNVLSQFYSNICTKYKLISNQDKIINFLKIENPYFSEAYELSFQFSFFYKKKLIFAATIYVICVLINEDFNRSLCWYQFSSLKNRLNKCMIWSFLDKMILKMLTFFIEKSLIGQSDAIMKYSHFCWFNFNLMLLFRIYKIIETR